mmetsp:Transcript_40681/g.71574  ORF Transcript_40681/g.71574 Transcript_40681/m.71574 type:complete len:234 (+) Transcript_40681:85-786(+)
MTRLILQSVLYLSRVTSLLAHEDVPDAMSLLQLPNALQVISGSGMTTQQQHQLFESQAEPQNRVQPDSANFTAMQQPRRATLQDKFSAASTLQIGLKLSAPPWASTLQMGLKLAPDRGYVQGVGGFLWFWVLAPIFISTGCCSCFWLVIVAYAYYRRKGSIIEFSCGVMSGIQEVDKMLVQPMPWAEKTAKAKQISHQFFDALGPDTSDVGSQANIYYQNSDVGSQTNLLEGS